jgi:hypothetical protein
MVCPPTIFLSALVSCATAGNKLLEARIANALVRREATIDIAIMGRERDKDTSLALVQLINVSFG